MNQNSGEKVGTDPLASEKITVDRKIFFLDLKENNRGRFPRYSGGFLGAGRPVQLMREFPSAQGGAKASFAVAMPRVVTWFRTPGKGAVRSRGRLA